jgi:hypothetical protein
MTKMAQRGEIELNYGDFSHGENTVDDPTKIGDKQVVSGFNAILRKNGFERRPGSSARTSAAGWVRGLHNYQQIDGTERLLAVWGDNLVEISKTTNSIATRYAMTGSGQAWFTDYLDTCFISNAGVNVKLEGATASALVPRIPTGASATAAAGAGLPNGVYQVYACYARQESGINVLYSSGQDLGAITLGSGNNQIAITWAEVPTDARITHKVIFMPDAGGSSYYFYRQVAKATTSFTVADTAQKNDAILYSVVAANNTVPPAFQFVYAFAGRLWGVVGNVLYYSLETADNEHDLSRFPSENTSTFPYAITGLFSVGADLYLNTKAGIIRQPNGDPTARFVHVEKRWYFTQMRTVQSWNGGVIGLTNDGVRFFDGEKFFDYDIGKHKRDVIDTFAYAAGSLVPCAAVYRRSIRTEYHWCWYDSTIEGALTHNRRLVLNLDRLEFLPGKDVVAPWETWGNGASYMTVDSAMNLYNAQTAEASSILYVEDSTTCADDGIYLDNGAVGDSESSALLSVVTKTNIVGTDFLAMWHQFRALTKYLSGVSVSIEILDFSGRDYAGDIE